MDWLNFIDAQIELMGVVNEEPIVEQKKFKYYIFF